MSQSKVQYNQDRASANNASNDIVGFRNGEVVKGVDNRADHMVDLRESDRRTERQKAELNNLNLPQLNGVQLLNESDVGVAEPGPVLVRAKSFNREI